MAGSSVVGLGAGVIILLVLWTLVGVAWVQLSSKQGGTRILITFIAILLTTTLLLIPTDDNTRREQETTRNPDLIKPQDAFEVYDYMFIWKGVLMVLMAVGCVGAVGVYLKEFWSMKVHGSLPIPKKKFEDFN